LLCRCPKSRSNASWPSNSPFRSRGLNLQVRPRPRPRNVIIEARSGEPTGAMPTAFWRCDRVGQPASTVANATAAKGPLIEQITIRTARKPRVRGYCAAAFGKIDADDLPRSFVVESDQTRGARLSVYDEQGFVHCHPSLATRNRLAGAHRRG